MVRAEQNRNSLSVSPPVDTASIAGRGLLRPLRHRGFRSLQHGMTPNRTSYTGYAIVQNRAEGMRADDGGRGEVGRCRHSPGLDEGHGKAGMVAVPRGLGSWQAAVLSPGCTRKLQWHQERDGPSMLIEKTWILQGTSGREELREMRPAKEVTLLVAREFACGNPPP